MKTPVIRGTVPMRHLLASAALVVTISCGPPLQIPLRTYQIPSGELRFVSEGGIEFGATAIVGLDRYWELFDDNLPESGIGAVWIEVRNQSASELNMSPVRWKLRGSQDQQGVSELDATAFFDRYYRMRRLRMIPTEADRKSKMDLENVRFQGVRIPPHSGRHGFLFFRIDPTTSEDWVGDSILIAERLRDSHGKTISPRVPLAHANP